MNEYLDAALDGGYRDEEAMMLAQAEAEHEQRMQERMWAEREEQYWAEQEREAQVDTWLGMPVHDPPGGA